MDSDSILTLCRRRAGLVVRAVGDELLVLDTEADQIHQLNRTASLIWHNCDEAGSTAEIAQLIVDRFEVDWDVAMQDVHAAIGKMRALNLVVPAGTADPASRG